MPQYSANTQGTYNVVIPAYAVNVQYSIGAAGGGSSQSTGSTSWYVAPTFGRAGDFRVATRNYDYTLTFYIGGRGGNGTGGDGFGNAGRGGSNAISSLNGGNGYNHGGGGGAGSAVYDNALGRYLAVVGGGPGAGRFNNGENIGGGIGGGATTGSLSTMAGRNAGAGNSGGGGGGNTFGRYGSSGGAAGTGGYNGTPGNSGYYNNSSYQNWTNNSGYANSGDGFYTLRFDYAPPNINSFTVSPTQIVSGENATLTWSTVGAINRTQITPTVGYVSNSGSVTVSPTQDTVYYLIVDGPGGTATSNVTLDVLVPPTVNLVSDVSNNTIVQGESATLSWTTSGDASSATLSPGFGNVNINSSVTVTPTVTTTYTVVVSHPKAGIGSDELTITVLQPPTVSLVGPSEVNYGDTVTLSYESQNVSQTHQLLIQYNYGDSSITTASYDLPLGDTSSGSFINTVPYSNVGPVSIVYTLVATGAGGLSDSTSVFVNVNIDTTPDLINIPESDDKLKNEEPVITPEEDSFLTLQVEDIDIPVEVKSEFPIQVEIDNSGIWVDVREI